ncbi:MAG: LysR family transcriptional regulator [Spirochaetales bacterium]|nr:LysR family transcriptional regulator [Spirochaetales bacterium]
MTERHMRIFVEVYNCLNMTKAAERLNMTQPAVTKAIKDIEDFYGIRLFERFNKGIIPTEKGKNVYNQALFVLSTYSKLEKELKDNTITGILKIGATISLGIYMLPSFVKDLKEKFPGLDIRVDIENGIALEKKLLTNALDIAFIEGPVQDKDLVGKRIMLDKLVVIASPRSKIKDVVTLAELSSYPMLLREKGSVTRRYIESMFISHNLTIDPIWESESSYAIINAVHEDIGISILPERIVSHLDLVGWVRMIKISDASLERVDHIVIHRHKYRSAVINELLDWDYNSRYMNIQNIY